MKIENLTPYEKHLARFGEDVWYRTLCDLGSRIHEVDRVPTQVWFRFFPLGLHRHLAETDDLDGAINGMALQGEFRLETQVDTSHRFLYGHRYWKPVKAAVIQRNEEFQDSPIDLTAEIRAIAGAASTRARADESLLCGIAAVGLMTLVQVGLRKFSETVGETAGPTGLLRKSPDKTVKSRSAEPRAGFFDFLKTVDKTFTVTWDESDKNANFEIILDEEIASAAAKDRSRNWLQKDERCIEGVIPVECRSAACGTCWVGVIAGAENLVEVAPLERKQVKVFGYRQDDEPKPFMRLACQAAAEGSVSIVIPPWNGVFGKKVYDNLERVELEPATTSAAKLRNAISEVLDE